MSLPPLPEPFSWTTESWGAGLRCRPLEAIAPHVFTTRQLSLSSPEGYALLAAAIGASSVARLNQVHGREVVAVRRRQPAVAASPAGDALVSDDPRVAVAVRAADCVPLLMADRARGVVAAVHAGWRGTAAKVAVAALATLGSEFGTDPKDVVVAIGPSIGPCCYEVGSELVDAFAAAGHERYLIQRWFATPPAPRGAMHADRPRLRLDVAGANRDQLVLAGVDEAGIFTANLCTAMHLDLLTSFRVEKENAGRIAGVIRARD
jgi:YfiH family protein